MNILSICNNFIPTLASQTVRASRKESRGVREVWKVVKPSWKVSREGGGSKRIVAAVKSKVSIK